jgi:thiol-disulfide isomerase/thioredoxin
MKSNALKLLIGLASVLYLGCSSTKVISPESVVVGNPAPEFSLPALDGTVVQSSSLKGNIVVLNFWATWCQPCMTEIPELKEVAANSKASVVGIALDSEGVSTIKPFVAFHDINYTVLVGNEDIFQAFNGVGIPYTLVLDSSQRIVKIYRGPTTREELEKDFRTINSQARQTEVSEPHGEQTATKKRIGG